MVKRHICIRHFGHMMLGKKPISCGFIITKSTFFIIRYKFSVSILQIFWTDFNFLFDSDKVTECLRTLTSQSYFLIFFFTFLPCYPATPEPNSGHGEADQS